MNEAETRAEHIDPAQADAAAPAQISQLPDRCRNRPWRSARRDQNRLHRFRKQKDKGREWLWIEYIASVMHAIAQAPEGAVLFHCHLGKDRTGLIGQLLLAALGVDENVVRDDYLLTNSCLEPWFVEIRATHAPTPEKLVEVEDWLHHWMYAPTEMVPGTFAYLAAKFGNARNYLKHIGLTESEIGAIEARLLE